MQMTSMLPGLFMHLPQRGSVFIASLPFAIFCKQGSDVLYFFCLLFA